MDEQTPRSKSPKLTRKPEPGSLDTHFLYRHCHFDKRDGNAVGLTGLL